MLTQKAIKEKLFKLPDSFMRYYQEGKFSQAYDTYTTAIKVAVFCELDEIDQATLFGGRPFDMENTGLFDEKLVQKCSKEMRRPR